MKTKIIALAVFAVVTTSISAQEAGYDTRSQLHLGLKGGINYSGTYDSDNEEYKSDGKIGFVGGAFLSIPIGTLLGIQPEFLFSQKGFKSTSTILGNNVTLTRTTNYIDIPIFLTIKPIEMVTFLVGPQYSFLMKQNDKFSNPITDIEVNQDFDTDNIRKNTLCIITGVDVNLGNIVLGARVGWDMFNNNGDGTSTTPRYKNVWGQATVGFRL